MKEGGKKKLSNKIPTILCFVKFEIKLQGTTNIDITNQMGGIGNSQTGPIIGETTHKFFYAGKRYGNDQVFVF